MIWLSDRRKSATYGFGNYNIALLRHTRPNSANTAFCHAPWQTLDALAAVLDITATGASAMPQNWGMGGADADRSKTAL
jgi:hypothetical protein